MPPFWPGEGSYGQSQMYMRIVNGKYTFDNPEWASVSTRTRSLVQKMVSIEACLLISSVTSHWLLQLVDEVLHGCVWTLEHLLCDREVLEIHFFMFGVMFTVVLNSRLCTYR